jgi:hypothetical protein
MARNSLRASERLRAHNFLKFAISEKHDKSPVPAIKYMIKTRLTEIRGQVPEGLMTFV